MTDYPELVHPILNRFHEKLPKRISCGQGWYSLLSALDRELSAVDPEYKLVQVKEKFGTLRYYYDASDNVNDEALAKMKSIVMKYEKISAYTCEVTGGHGRLMHKDNWFRTLNDSHIAQGWTPCE